MGQKTWLVNLCCTLMTLSSAGYSATQAWADSAPPTPELHVATTNDADRNAISLNTALLGQWRTDNGNTRYYFGPEKVTIVYELSGEHSLTYEQVLSYQVLSMNEQANVLRLNIQTPLNRAESRLIRFAGDRTTMLESIQVLGQFFGNEWIYVNDLQRPTREAQEPSLRDEEKV